MSGAGCAHEANGGLGSGALALVTGSQARHGAFHPWPRQAADAAATLTYPTLASAGLAPGTAATPAAGAPSRPESGASSSGVRAGAAGQGTGEEVEPGVGLGSDLGIVSGSNLVPRGQSAGAQSGVGGGGGSGGDGHGNGGGARELRAERTHYCYLFREEGARRAQGW